MRRNFSYLVILSMLLSLALSACSSTQNGALTGSGTLSAIEVPIAPELGGRVTAIYVGEGDTVQAGDVLFQIDDEPFQVQRDQAQAAVSAAEATLDAAQAQLVYIQLQYDIAAQGAHAQDIQSRQVAWNVDLPDDFRPAWYYQRSEAIAAAQAEVDAAQEALADEQTTLASELAKASNQDFVAVEQRLAQAQVGYQVAQATLDQAKASNDDNLVEAAQDVMDSAQAELDVAVLNYDSMLTTASAEAVLQARARLAVAQSRLDYARDGLLQLQTGDESLQVEAAQAAVDQAETAVSQAQANLDQAKVAVKLVELQLERTQVKAPSAGRVLTRNLEIGEIVGAGSVVMTVAQLERLDLIVYLSEDQYGKVQVGDSVSVQVDSFSGQTFDGQVMLIADQAEFTPRNAQTVEGRRATVYAIKVNVPNPEGALKPGMPADVKFGE